MLLFPLTLLTIGAAILWKARLHRRILDIFTELWLRIQAAYLPSTRITIDQSQFGHIIPVNDELHLIRHASGRLAYLPVRRHMPQRRPLPRALKALLLTFFTL